MKNNRNCGAGPFPMYPSYPPMGMAPGIVGMPNPGMGMAPGMGMTPGMGSGMPTTNVTADMQTDGLLEQQVNSMRQQLNSLERRVAQLENVVGQTNNYNNNNYNTSSYQML